MALGRRGKRTVSKFIAATDLPRSGGHPSIVAWFARMSDLVPSRALHSPRSVRADLHGQCAFLAAC